MSTTPDEDLSVGVDVNLEATIPCEGTDWDDSPCPRQAKWHAITTCCRTHFSLCEEHRVNHEMNILLGTEFYCPVCAAAPMEATWTPL